MTARLNSGTPALAAGAAPPAAAGSRRHVKTINRNIGFAFIGCLVGFRRAADHSMGKSAGGSGVRGVITSLAFGSDWQKGHGIFPKPKQRKHLPVPTQVGQTPSRTLPVPWQ